MVDRRTATQWMVGRSTVDLLMDALLMDDWAKVELTAYLVKTAESMDDLTVGSVTVDSLMESARPRDGYRHHD